MGSSRFYNGKILPSPRRLTLFQVTAWSAVLVHLILSVEGVSTSIDRPFQQHPNLQISPRELRRLRVKGLEMVPSGNAVSGGTISEEPSCEELRAMWRYYRRQARAAELTNQIPQFQLQDFFWDKPREPASFGPLRGRTRPRFRPKGPQNPLYGRVLFKPEKTPESGRRRRPMEEVIQMFGMPSSSRAKSPNTEKSDEPIIHLTPSLEPTPKSGIDKIKDILREERVKAGEILSPNPTRESQGVEYGKVILSPPNGHDGRVANKPRELMTPFERIRFGHVDDLFNGNDDTPRRQGSNLFPAKRRNGFIALPMLNRQRSPWNSLVLQGPQQETRFRPPPVKLDDSLIIPEDLKNRGQPAEFGIASSEINKNSAFIGKDFRDEFNNEDLISAVTDFDLDNAPIQVRLEKEPLLVEETIPLCFDVKDQPCSINSDCSCIGVGLYRCHTGQCQTLSLKGAVPGGNGGVWHSEPLSFSELGIWEDSSPPAIRVVLEDKKRKREVDLKKA